MSTRTAVKITTLAVAVSTAALAVACSKDQAATPLAPTPLTADRAGNDEGHDGHIRFVDRSVTPALVKNVMSGVKVTTLLSSDDTLPQTPRYVFGGSTDGAGLLRNGNGYTLLVNNEDNFSVSRLTLDSQFKPVAGEYVVNSDNGMFRLCSATLATPEVQGFGPLFITSGESGVESMTRAVDPFGAPNTSRPLTAFGRWSAENAVPLPAEAFEGKTVVVIGDDDSGPYGGQIALYVSDKVGDLDNGRLYVLARPDHNPREMDLKSGVSYPVVFEQIENQKTLTGLQINQKAQALGAVAFGRVEDVDFRHGKGDGREIYFNVTGQFNSGVNADYSRSKYGRVYKLVLDEKSPTKGRLEVVLNGDDRSASNPAHTFQNPDNIVATKNFLYIEEDPNEYGDETHDSYLYQYNLKTKELKVVLELDHRRDAPDAAKYNTAGQGNYTFKASGRGSWENSGMLDISDVVGEPGTFLFGVQAHTWRGARYRNPDGGLTRASEDQASQLLVLRGLAR
jgi:secreted PhoX family phosphatase